MPTRTFAFVFLSFLTFACESAPDLGGNPVDPASGAWDNVDGLILRKNAITLHVPADVVPSNSRLTLEPIDADAMLPDGVSAGNGFDAGAIFGPSGTTFSAPVRVTVTLKVATPLDSLPVLLYDESTGKWGWAGMNATVESDGITASFEVTHFSRYRVWNPPPPVGDLPIEDGDIIAGTGSFEGQPFNTFPNPHAADASLVYSPFGNAFGLSLVQIDVTNPTTGDFFILSAGLHATMVGDLDKAKVAIVTPAGGFSGPSAFIEGTGAPKPISGIMYLRKNATHWMVDVYCAYEGGIVFGQATGEL